MICDKMGQDKADLVTLHPRVSCREISPHRLYLSKQAGVLSLVAGQNRNLRLFHHDFFAAEMIANFLSNGFEQRQQTCIFGRWEGAEHLFEDGMVAVDEPHAEGQPW